MQIPNTATSIPRSLIELSLHRRIIVVIEVHMYTIEACSSCITPYINKNVTANIDLSPPDFVLGCAVFI